MQFTRQLPGQSYDQRVEIATERGSRFRVRHVFDNPGNPHVVRATLMVLLPHEDIQNDIYECSLRNGFDAAVDYVNLGLYEPNSNFPLNDLHNDYRKKIRQRYFSKYRNQ